MLSELYAILGLCRRVDALCFRWPPGGPAPDLEKRVLTNVPVPGAEPMGERYLPLSDDWWVVVNWMPDGWQLRYPVHTNLYTQLNTEHFCQWTVRSEVLPATVRDYDYAD